MTVLRVKELIKQCVPDILFLSETKNQDDFVFEELAPLNFDKNFLFSPLHQPGGMGLFWKSDIYLQILSANQNLIDTHISFRGSSFNNTFIYGAPEIPKRQEVWNQLINMSLSRDSPWFLTGDFNEIVGN